MKTTISLVALIAAASFYLVSFLERDEIKDIA